MPYTHFGNQADVWKHLALCEVISTEKPRTYIETNSASAIYPLDHNPEQAFGIGYFLEKAPGMPGLQNSIYHKIESRAATDRQYIGSPGLAMTILKNITGHFVFFDIEKPPLENIRAFAGKIELHEKIKTFHQDSLTGLPELLQDIGHNCFIHFDPYYVDRPGPEGYDYIDLFIKAAQSGHRCFLWYGFHTLSEKTRINAHIREKVAKGGIKKTLCVELILETIWQKTILCNPGILGSGLLCGNLSEASVSAVLNCGALLVKLHTGSFFGRFKGELYREILTF